MGQVRKRTINKTSIYLLNLSDDLIGLICLAFWEIWKISVSINGDTALADGLHVQRAVRVEGILLIPLE